MKSLLTTFIALLVGSYSISQITLIPDAAFEGELISLGIDSDGTINGQVFTDDIDGVTELDLSWIGVEDMTGIEDFVSLTDLNCSFNPYISSLDVSSLPNLVELRYAVTSVTEIDLSSNPLLETLDFVDTGTSEIDLSENPNLKVLWALDNELTELDLTANVNLEILGCPENKITHLDLTLNTSLTEIYCHKNDLIFLKMNNGSNEIITDFSSTDNPDLECIMVDDSTFAADNFIMIDDQSYFSENCYSSVSELDLQNTVVYPNPAVDMLTIEIDQSASYEVQTINGKTAQQGLLFTGKNELNLAELERGFYIIQIQKGESLHAIKLTLL